MRPVQRDPLVLGVDQVTASIALLEIVRGSAGILFSSSLSFSNTHNCNFDPLHFRGNLQRIGRRRLPFRVSSDSTRCTGVDRRRGYTCARRAADRSRSNKSASNATISFPLLKSKRNSVASQLSPSSRVILSLLSGNRCTEVRFKVLLFKANICPGIEQVPVYSAAKMSSSHAAHRGMLALAA